MLAVDESSEERVVVKSVVAVNEEALPIIPLLVDLLDHTLANVKDVEVLIIEEVVIVAVEIAFRSPRS